jgi:topoisomerase-4 subunit A
MTVSEVIQYYAKKLTEILRAELKLEEDELNDKLHAKTLEQIFVEERIYKKIEKMKTRESVIKAVIKGFEPFAEQIEREVTTEDTERLLKIPIRRISLYDIHKAQQEMDEIKTRLKEIKKHLANLVKYAVSFLDLIIDKYKDQHPRKTEIISFDKVDVREAAQRNLKLKYDKTTGYLGHEVGGNTLFDVSLYDRILVIRKTGLYSVMDVPDKFFVDKGMRYCGFVDEKTTKDTIFTVVFKNNTNGYTYIKRCKIEKYILNKGYSIVPEKCTPLYLTTEKQGTLSVEYKPKPRLKVKQEEFQIEDYLVKGVKAGGVRLANKEAKSVRFIKNKEENLLL